MNIRQLFVAASILALPVLAFAGTDGCPPDCVIGRVPEPETLALLAIGAVALTIARWRNKR